MLFSCQFNKQIMKSFIFLILIFQNKYFNTQICFFYFEPRCIVILFIFNVDQHIIALDGIYLTTN